MLATRFCSDSNWDIIAIDGPAGAGKSTVAKLVAERLGYQYLDTGAMYRAVTLKAIQDGVDLSDQNSLQTCARTAAIHFSERDDSPFPAVFIGDQDVTEAIRSPRVAQLVSEVAKDPGVRACMTEAQKRIGKHGKWVVDGRDIGTVVFPAAPVKIFLTASIEERARRRMSELEQQGYPSTLDSLMVDIQRRDEIDSSRVVAPLRQAEGAVLLDTTILTIKQVVERIITIVATKDANILTEEPMEEATTTKEATETMEKAKEPEEAMEKVKEPMGEPKNKPDTPQDTAPAEEKLAAQPVVTEEEEAPMTMAELEEQMAGEFTAIRNGAIVTGHIVGIHQDGIYVNIGYKSDGIIHPEEFAGEDIELKVGNEIQVLIRSIDDGHGQVRLSYRKAREHLAWDSIQEAFHAHKPIEGTLKERIKGGYNVFIGGVRAFLPQSQLSHGKNIKESIGQAFPMMVTEFDKRRRNVVVSERAVVEEGREKHRQEIFANYQVNDMIKGVVSRIVEYGAFIDLGDGVEGLIHRNDLSWSVIANPREVVQPGEEIEAVILKLDTEKRKIGLGLKQKKDDPWASVDERYVVNQRYEGRVKNLMDFGAFVELEEGVEGLVHISDLSWARNVRHPGDIVKSGDVIQVLVKDIDKEKKRISLSYKDTLPHPWESVALSHKSGDVVRGRVNNLTEFGAFIEIAPGVEGLLHISDMDWVKKINHPKDVLEKGQEVEVKVLSIDSGNRRLSLGLKQTTVDPWDSAENNFRVGDVVTGVVKNLVSYGAFVQLDNGLEGLLHISEFSWLSDVKDPAEILNVGDQVTVSIYEVDKGKQKIGLSLRRMTDDPWKQIEQTFRVNTVHKGIIAKVQDQGAEIEVADGVLGFIHISQIAQNRVVHPSEAVKVGDEVMFKVLELDRKNRRLKLSIKEAVMDADKQELRKFQAESSQGFSDTIGDLLRDQFQAVRDQLKK